MTIVSEPSAEELGHEVVQVEDDGNALDPRNDGAEDEEVRKVVDLDGAVATTPMKRRQPHGCQDEEPQVAQELACEARLGESHREAMDLDALVHGVRGIPFFAHADDVDLEPGVDERLGFAFCTRVSPTG